MAKRVLWLLIGYLGAYVLLLLEWRINSEAIINMFDACSCRR